MHTGNTMGTPMGRRRPGTGTWMTTGMPPGANPASKSRFCHDTTCADMSSSISTWLGKSPKRSQHGQRRHQSQRETQEQSPRMLHGGAQQRKHPR